jgi:hypothetical protein
MFNVSHYVYVNIQKQKQNLEHSVSISNILKKTSKGLKRNVKARAGGVAQAVHHLPSKHEALSPNPTITR